MRLRRNVLLVSILLLFQCTVSSDGFILALLVKIIALKGALFIGTPIALGAFVVGQGLGFLVGNLAGGYAVLKTAQKYHEKEKAKWHGKGKGHGHGWGWGWHGPKYSTGYKKGYGVGNAIANYVNHVKTKPSYHDYYAEGYAYGPVSHSYGPVYESPYTYGPVYSSPSSGYSAPPSGYSSPPSGYSSPPSGYGSASYHVPSYGVPVESGYHRYDSPSATHAYSTIVPKEPSLLDRLTSKLPSFLGGKPKGDPHPGFAPPPPPGYVGPQPFAADHGMLHAPHPMDMYYQPAGMQIPAQSYAPPHPGAGTLPANFPQLMPHGPAPSPEVNSYRPLSNKEPVKLFEDSEYVYSSSPYAKPQPKRPLAHIAEPDMYPGSAASYDGPAKEYTGVMTDIYESIQKMKTKPYGGKPLGNPMGLPEFSVSVSDDYASASEKDEQMLNLAASLHNAQRRKDAANSKIRPNFAMEKFLESKLQEKAEKAKNEEQRKEVKQIISLLRKAYLQQLAESMDTENEGTDDDENQEKGEPNESESTPENEPSIPEQEVPSASEQTAEISKFLPLVTNRFKREQVPESSTQNPLEALTSEQLEQVKMLYSFMEEIKQFFTLVSVLDEDTCLQKMVCDVHAKKALGHETNTDNSYVMNMISTFAIMDLIVPFDPSAPEDSTTRYRLAAKIGSIGASTEVCKRYYSVCGYSSEEIIQLGNQMATALPPQQQTEQPPQGKNKQQQPTQDQPQQQQQPQAQPTETDDTEDSLHTSPLQFGDRLQRKIEEAEPAMPKV